jgi:hypothetical protein
VFEYGSNLKASKRSTKTEVRTESKRNVMVG